MRENSHEFRAIAARRTGMSPNAYQAEHDLLREVLRRCLVAKVQSPRGAEGLDPMVYGAVAALDSLLAAHSVDGRGRCWSCRSPGWLGRRRRMCVVFRKARYWLRQPTHRVQAHLAAELGVDLTAPPGAADPEAIEVLPVIADNPPTDPWQTPAVPSPLAPRGPRREGPPDRDHGGTGNDPLPDSPRPRRGRSEDPPPGPCVFHWRAFRWRHDMAGLTGTDTDATADLTLPTTTMKPEEHEIQDHHPRAAR